MTRVAAEFDVDAGQYWVQIHVDEKLAWEGWVLDHEASALDAIEAAIEIHRQG
jgi:hypothetical protein